MLAWLSGTGRLQLLEQSSLAVGQPLRHMNLKPDIKVAARISAEGRQTLSAQAQDRVGLCAGGDVDGYLAVEERHVHAGAQHGVYEIDGLSAVKITAAPLEPRIVGAANGADPDKGGNRRR